MTGPQIAAALFAAGLCLTAGIHFGTKAILGDSVRHAIVGVEALRAARAMSAEEARPGARRSTRSSDNKARARRSPRGDRQPSDDELRREGWQAGESGWSAR